MLSRFLFLSLASLFLSACSSFEFPWVYKISVQQGNILDQEKIDQLEIGMTKRQVQFVMGSPLLTDTFNPDRWDYYYSRRDGKGNTKEDSFIVFFENDIYVRHEGSLKPSTEKSTEDKQAAATDADTQEVIDDPESTIKEHSVY